MSPTCFDRVAVPVVMENAEPGKTCGEAEQHQDGNLVQYKPLLRSQFSFSLIVDPLHLDPERGLASFQ